MTAAELQQILNEADPDSANKVAAVLVSPRILENVLREQLNMQNVYWNLPHSKSWVCDRRTLFQHAEQADLEVRPDQVLPDTIILLARPDAEEMSNLERKPLLLKYWRRLFHSRVHLALANLPTGPEGEAAIRKRVEEIGRVEFAEVRNVLVEDVFLARDADERTVYIEFAAVYLEMRHFAASLLPNFFPGIRDFGKIERVLGRDVNSQELFGKTRLRDAPDPVMPTDTRSDESQEAYWALVRGAARSALAGNIVWAAIQRMRASRIAPAALTLPTRHEAEGDIARLGDRLAAALAMTPSEKTDWVRYMTLLLDKADQGARPVEAKVLDDLQQACIDHEAEIYTLDLVEFVLSLGKKPIMRPLPSQRLVRILKHLRDAHSRLGEVRLADTDRSHLARLMQNALGRCEEAMRGRFGPVVRTALEDVGLRPHNPLEQAAFDKLVAELLDRISTHGFLTFGELRDTIARNQLKLDDLKEPEDFIRGDPLVRLDRRLGALLDGVYRPGEIYVRYLERFTSLLFGTTWGRTFTLWGLIPVLLAWVTLYLMGMVLSWFSSAEKFPYAHFVSLAMMGPAHVEKPKATSETSTVSPDPGGAETPAAVGGAADADLPHPDIWWHLGLLLPVALFMVALLHSPTFRQRCWHLLLATWRHMYHLLFVLPLKILPWETLSKIFHSWLFQLLYWGLFKPLAICALVWMAVPGSFTVWYGSGLFAIAFLLVNSQIGRATSDRVRDMMVRVFSLLRSGLLPAFLRFVIRLFKQLVEWIEYGIFLVDEWLRSRNTDNKTSLVLRTLAGVIWAPVSFVMRFYMVVLVEPCINPVKLPISSIAAKFVYPMLLALNLFDPESMSSPLVAPLGQYITYPVAWFLVIGTFFLLPDVFGFLIWEMKENWNLYKANRGETIRPASVGGHGETIRGLLQPGFHSGTVPAVYARLRVAERRAIRTRNWYKVRAYRDEVKEICESLARFVEREIVALLRQSKAWANEPVKAGHVMLATNRIRFQFLHEEHPVHPVEVEIEYFQGWLVAGFRQTGWLDQLTPEQARVFAACLAYLYKRSDVDLVFEQVTAELGADLAQIQLENDRVTVRESTGEVRVFWLRGELERSERVDDVNRLVFARTQLTWEHWWGVWADENGCQGLPGLGEKVWPWPGRLCVGPEPSPETIFPESRASSPAAEDPPQQEVSPEPAQPQGDVVQSATPGVSS